MATPNADDSARRSRLLALKLAALVRDHLGDAPVEPGVFAGGAALTRLGEAWVLADERPVRALGPAMAWARKQGCAGLHLAAEEASGVLARRAGLLGAAAEVLRVDGRGLAIADVAGYPAAVPFADAADALRGVIAEAGADPVVEHGVLVGEVAGLEVCRVVTDPFTDEIRLEVGIGAHDREAFLLIHGSRPPVEALRGVVESVAPHRRRGAGPHPLNRLAAERLLRHRLLDEPALVGAAALAPADPPVVRVNLKDAVPCVASGQAADGSPIVVVCSTGIDLDLVPFAADARAYLGDPSAELVIVVPERDRHPVTEALAASLGRPWRIVTVDGV